MPPETSPDRPPSVRLLHALIDVLKRRIGGRGLSWSAFALGTVVVAFAVWPLAAAAWDLLGLTRPQTFHVAVSGLGAVLVAGGLAGLRRNRSGPIRLAWLIAAAWAVAAGAIALMTALAWLALGAPTWDPPTTLTPRALDAIATRAFAIVAGLGGVALLVINYRRQRTNEAENDRADLEAVREDTKLFTERFTTASAQLGDEQPAVRLAGVHALAHLADDAPTDELVQMVIDVLCAYLRMPYEAAPAPLRKNAAKAQREEHRKRELEFAALREVRHTIIRVIRDHLRADTHWRGKDYDFTGAVFDGGNLIGAAFTGGRVSFSHVHFTDGWTAFNSIHFCGADVFFTGARFSGGQVVFNGTHFTGGKVTFLETRFIGSSVSFTRTRFLGGDVSFERARFLKGEVHFMGSVISEDEDWDARGTIPEGLLDAVATGEPGVVRLPEAWRVDAVQGDGQGTLSRSDGGVSASERH